MNNGQLTRDVNPIAAFPNSTPENYLQNEVKLLESENAGQSRRRATRRTGREDGNQFRLLLSLLITAPTAPVEEVQIKAVQKALSMRTSLQSQVLDLSFDAPSPALAARGANLAASELVSLNREARLQSAQDTTDWLNKQATDLKATREPVVAYVEREAHAGSQRCVIYL